MQDNSGSIRKNQKKETSAQPDFRGSAIVGGVPYWVSLWRKETDGDTWYSLAFELRQEVKELN